MQYLIGYLKRIILNNNQLFISPVVDSHTLKYKYLVNFSLTQIVDFQGDTHYR